jgi:arylsulfatase A
MKGEIYEGGHRVPFIVKWPGQYPENTTSEEVISSVDIMATVASIVGYELPADVAEDSYNLSSVFQGGKTKTAEDSKFVREAIVHHSAKGHFSIRQDRWKLIPQLGTGGILNRDDNLWFTKSVAFFSNLFLSEAQAQQPSGQLYDLAADPAEKNNLWLEYPAVVDRLLKTLERYKSEGRSVIR